MLLIASVWGLLKGDLLLQLEFVAVAVLVRGRRRANLLVVTHFGQLYSRRYGCAVIK